MERNQTVLHVSPGSHLLSGPHQDTHLPGPHLGEQFFFPRFGVGIVDIGDLVLRDA